MKIRDSNISAGVWLEEMRTRRSLRGRWSAWRVRQFLNAQCDEHVELLLRDDSKVTQFRASFYVPNGTIKVRTKA